VRLVGAVLAAPEPSPILVAVIRVDIAPAVVARLPLEAVVTHPLPVVQVEAWLVLQADPAVEALSDVDALAVSAEQCLDLHGRLNHLAVLLLGDPLVILPQPLGVHPPAARSLGEAGIKLRKVDDVIAILLGLGHHVQPQAEVSRVVRHHRRIPLRSPQPADVLYPLDQPQQATLGSRVELVLVVVPIRLLHLRVTVISVPRNHDVVPSRVRIQGAHKLHVEVCKRCHFGHRLYVWNERIRFHPL
jgi:hypothetical protein